MTPLIELDKFIKQAKKEGVDFGKGDPYNRLRYFTKIGWLPHMIRKKIKSGEIKGHYPKWALDRLIQIDKLRKQGASNEQIADKINTKNKLDNLYSKVNTEDFKTKIITYVTALVVLIILLNELDIISFSKSKNQEIMNQVENLPSQIVESGISFVPSNKNKIFIKSDKITASSKVYVTFNQSYSPATRYWVSKIEAQKGFFVELDAPVFDNTEFTWWTSN